ncbi:unnamed protein product [Lactuca saligna]|uniref:Uncharacterized protein n=1 Tax=Lactuca saligna TaxID=75948 RepID=A0AA36EHZ9_LACSI|nr:unnamed protein product [Lactuca saligna]
MMKMIWADSLIVLFKSGLIAKMKPLLRKGNASLFTRKINQLILASQDSSCKAYSKVAVESILERVIKDHVTNAYNMANVVSNSIDVCKSMTEKVDKLIANTIYFMEDYNNTYNSNTIIANKAIQNVGAMLKVEKANFVKLHKEFLSNNEAFQSSHGGTCWISV